MKFRIQNNAKGGRGIYVNGELVSLGVGNTQSFESAKAGEIEDAAANREFRVWTDSGNGWEEITKPEDAPIAKPFIAVAKGSSGENMRPIDLADGEWFVGYALSADKPDGPAGYEWVKVGGGAVSEVFVPALSGKIVPLGSMAPDYRTPVSTMTVGGGEEDNFNAESVIVGNAPDVIAALDSMTLEQIALVKAAEADRERPRKGVMDAIDDKLKAGGENDPFAQ